MASIKKIRYFPPLSPLMRIRKPIIQGIYKSPRRVELKCGIVSDKGKDDDRALKNKIRPEPVRARKMNSNF